MVFGNRGDDSGTGVAFTRDPATGEKVPYGDYLSNAQGEDVVAGHPQHAALAELEQLDPPAYAELRAAMDTLEGHYRDMCDIEFTIEKRHVLAPADAHRQADRVRRVGDGLRHAGGGADRRRRGAAARGREPSGGAVQAAGRRRGVCRRGIEPIADGAERVPGRGERQGRVQRRRGAGVGRPRRARDPRPPRDHARRLPRHDRVAGHPDERRRHQLARRGRRSRRGHPGGVRRGRDQARRRREDVLGRRHHGRRGRGHHDRRLHRQGLRRRGCPSRSPSSRRRGRATPRRASGRSGRRSRR